MGNINDKVEHGLIKMIHCSATWLAIDISVIVYAAIVAAWLLWLIIVHGD